MNKLSIVAVLLLSSLFLAGCTGQTGTNTVGNSDVTGVEQDSRTGQPSGEDSTDSDQISLVMDNYSYSRSTIEAKPGETITINLVNRHGEHDFVIDELNVDSGILDANESKIVTFTVPANAQPGDSYDYYCSVGDHRAMGMFGTLRIVE